MAYNKRILLFGDERSCQEALPPIKEAMGETVQILYLDDLEILTTKLVDWDPSLVIVVANGAEGMECAYRSHERRPCIPVFWFSDDPQFSLQSYRLDCAYFSVKPVTGEKLDSAFQRCTRMGIRFNG